MATVEEIMNEAQRELSYAAGRNVQIHVQDRMGYKIGQLFRKLSTQIVWDHQYRSEVFTLNGTGSITTNLKERIPRSIDVLDVYRDKETTSLSWVAKGNNIAAERNYALSPTPSANLPFTILPIGATGTVTINFKEFKRDDFRLDDEVEMDRDLMVFGVATHFAVADALNPELGQLLRGQFLEHLQLLEKQQIRSVYTRDGAGTTYPMEWFVV